MKDSRFRGLIAGVLVGLVLMIVALVAGRASRLMAQEPNRAAVVVRYEDGDVDQRCVEFEEPEISGHELLQRSGLVIDARFEGLGGITCRIEGTGCPSDDCFCQCEGGESCIYWSYWHLGAEGWQYARTGATSFQVSHGDVEGWSWGPGSVTSAIEPPALSFDEICSSGIVRGSGATTSGTSETEAPPNFLAFGAIAGAMALLLIVVRQRRSHP